MDPVRPPPPRARRVPGILALGALGVVFGDIGTNVLFALRAAFNGPHAVRVTSEAVLGLLSLIFWALILVLGVKYLGFIMRADNRGEGGILALLALVAPRSRAASWRKTVLVWTGIFGAALLYGDGAITPAISVLAALEGLATERPALQGVVVPATVAILVVLFLVQHRGTGRLGSVFGPVMFVWFVCIATLGIRGIISEPGVLVAANPLHAAAFLAGHGGAGFLTLGAVVLTVAGAEALYADLGHFGAAPIRLAWYGLVFPALLLNYFGQGAALLADPGAAQHPFYALVPLPLHFAMVGLATLATIIASQALISGAFSLARQAIQLGYLPRATVRHTSSTMPGQIYVPEVNFVLMLLCVGLVLAFRESSRLAAAYGMAIAGAMATTTVLYFSVVRERWHWRLAQAAGITLVFLTIDLAFLGANVVKIPYGAWIPLVVAGAVHLLMSTWWKGEELIAGSLAPVPFDSLLHELAEHPPVRVPGVAVFLSTREGFLPHELIHYMRRTRTLAERVVVMFVSAVDVPRVAEAERIEVRGSARGIVQVSVRYGFMESPDVPLALERSGVLQGVPGEEITYFVGQATVIRTERPGMARWRKALFIALRLISRPARLHLGLPAAQVVEVGMDIEL